MPTAAEPGPALSAGQASGARPGRSTRLRDNHARIKVERTHWRVKSPETGWSAFLSAIEGSVRFCCGVPKVARLLLWWERSPPRWRVPRGTRQRWGTNAGRRGYGLSADDPVGPFGSRHPAPGPRVLPAGELSQQSGSRVEVNALARWRHHRSLSGIRGGARRDSRRATRRHLRSLRSGAARRPLHPWRQGSPAESLGDWGSLISR